MEITRRNRHPLETVEILEQIFSNLKFSDLKECRLVCRIWLEESSRTMRPLGKVEVKCQKVGRISHFFERMKSKKRGLFQVPYYSKLSFLGPEPLVSQLYHFFGDHIKSLEFHSIRFKTADKFLKLVSEHCPKLEHLILENISISGRKLGLKKKSMQFSIKSVKTLNCDTVTASEFEKHGVQILEQFPFLEVLFANNTPDAQLGLDVNQLLCLPNNRTLPKLEKLHLHNEELQKLNFLDSAPNLKTLNLTFGIFHYLSNDIDSVYPNVRDLGVICSSRFRLWTYTETLELLARVFPNVENLDLGRTSCIGVSLAWIFWPNLKSITAQFTPKVAEEYLALYDFEE